MKSSANPMIQKMTGMDNRDLQLADPLKIISHLPTELRQKIMKNQIDRAQRNRDLLSSKYLYNMIAANQDMNFSVNEAVNAPTEHLGRIRQEYMDNQEEFSIRELLNRPFMGKFFRRENQDHNEPVVEVRPLTTSIHDDIDNDDVMGEIATVARFGANLGFKLEQGMPNFDKIFRDLGIGIPFTNPGFNRTDRNEDLSESALVEEDELIRNKIYEIQEEYDNEYNEMDNVNQMGVIGESFGGRGGSMEGEGYHSKYGLVGGFMTQGLNIVGKNHPHFSEYSYEMIESPLVDILNEDNTTLEDGSEEFEFDLDEPPKLKFNDPENEERYESLLSEYNEVKEMPLENYMLMPKWTQSSMAQVNKNLLKEYNRNRTMVTNLFHLHNYYQFKGKNDPTVEQPILDEDQHNIGQAELNRYYGE